MFMQKLLRGSAIRKILKDFFKQNVTDFPDGRCKGKKCIKMHKVVNIWVCLNELIK